MKITLQKSLFLVRSYVPDTLFCLQQSEVSHLQPDINFHPCVSQKHCTVALQLALPSNRRWDTKNEIWDSLFYFLNLAVCSHVYTEEVRRHFVYIEKSVKWYLHTTNAHGERHVLCKRLHNLKIILNIGKTPDRFTVTFQVTCHKPCSLIHTPHLPQMSMKIVLQLSTSRSKR